MRFAKNVIDKKKKCFFYATARLNTKIKIKNICKKYGLNKEARVFISI